MEKNYVPDIILHFKGDLNYDIIGELIGLLKDKMKIREARYGLYKKLLTLLIESLENIVRYNQEIPSRSKFISKNPPELYVSLEGKYYMLSTSNAILNNDIPPLQQRIDHLNSLNKTKLKELYKETITDGKFSEKGGAGLGIIEMAKIIDQHMAYTFTKMNAEFSLFRLQLYIRNSNGKSS